MSNDQEGLCAVKKAVEPIKLDALLAFAVYCITCIALHLIQYTLYGGALQTGFFYALINPPIFFLIRFINNSDTRAERQSERKRPNLLLNAALILVASILAIVINTDRNSLIGYQVFGVLISVSILEVIKKRRQRFEITVSSGFMAVYSSILIVSVAFLLITNPATIPSTRASLANDGYTNVAYVMYYQDARPLDLLFGDRLRSTEDAASGLGAYLFSGEMDGDSFGILVDIASGRSLHRENTDENRILAGVIELRREDN